MGKYRKMLLNQKKLSVFFAESPLVGEEADLRRDKSRPRDAGVLGSRSRLWLGEE